MVEYVYKMFPILIAVQIFMIPCQLPFIGSILLNSCSGWTNDFVMIRLGLSVFEFVNTALVLVPPIPYILFVLVSAIMLLWNECAMAHGDQSTMKYRNLQVLEKLVNSCVRYRILPVLTGVCPIVQIFAGYIITKFHSSMKISHLVFIMIMDYFCTLYSVMVLTAAGSIYAKSSGWIEKAKNACSKDKEKKIRRREIRSMMPIRIWFGSNFVDTLTALVIEDFCIGQIISLLLMG